MVENVGNIDLKIHKTFITVNCVSFLFFFYKKKCVDTEKQSVFVLFYGYGMAMRLNERATLVV